MPEAPGKPLTNLESTAFANQMHQTHEFCKAELTRARDRMVKFYDKKKEDREFDVGDWVYLKTSYIHTKRPSRKLEVKHASPYQIVKRIGLLAYKLKLPLELNRIHNVFNVDKLQKVRSQTIPGQPVYPPPRFEA